MGTIDPALRDEELLPGSLSRELLTGVLREQFGFNGLSRRLYYERLQHGYGAGKSHSIQHSKRL